jgi:hypothetical protein
MTELCIMRRHQPAVRVTDVTKCWGAQLACRPDDGCGWRTRTTSARGRRPFSIAPAGTSTTRSMRWGSYVKALSPWAPLAILRIPILSNDPAYLPPSSAFAESLDFVVRVHLGVHLGSCYDSRSNPTMTKPTGPPINSPSSKPIVWIPRMSSTKTTSPKKRGRISN